MLWMDLYGSDKEPTQKQISEFISNPMWEDVNSFLKDGYQVEPTVQYSRCSGQPGWNVKYQKGGRSLCTLYPMEGYFIALVVIGSKEEAETQLLLPMLTEYTQELYKNTKSLSSMGRWLMINVTDEKISDDVKRPIQIRRKIKV